MENEMHAHAEAGSVVLIATYVILCLALAVCNALYLLNVIGVPPAIGSNLIIVALGVLVWKRRRRR